MQELNGLRRRLKSTHRRKYHESCENDAEYPVTDVGAFRCHVVIVMCLNDFLNKIKGFFYSRYKFL
jgi:hypothetical protein